MMCAGYLASEAESPKTIAMVGRITAASHRMARLVSEVMDISKLQSGMDLGMDLRPTDCNALIVEMIAETRLAFPDAQIAFEARGDGIVMADPDRMSQVLTNLISNAVSHGEAGREISISSVKSEKELTISVANFAPLLNEKLLADIFSPYKSGAPGQARNKDGLGLGLHIAREIVHGHHGAISVSQNDGVISFRIQLPIGEIST
jgi:chemotaxis family two-component system sensor kinase Cph1